MLSALCLTEVDRMLEGAKTVTRDGTSTADEYARVADDRDDPVDAQAKEKAPKQSRNLAETLEVVR